MSALAGPDAFISVQGDLSDWKLGGVPQIAREPRGALKRHDNRAEKDFAILPLQQDTSTAIFREISRLGFSRRIIHVQIEKAGDLAFGAHDNFHHECVYASDAVSKSVLGAIVEAGLPETYRVDS